MILIQGRRRFLVIVCGAISFCLAGQPSLHHDFDSIFLPSVYKEVVGLSMRLLDDVLELRTCCSQDIDMCVVQDITLGRFMRLSKKIQALCDEFQHRKGLGSGDSVYMLEIIATLRDACHSSVVLADILEDIDICSADMMRRLQKFLQKAC